jgi:hypothetical protein
MKLVLDPMPALRDLTTHRVNAHFNDIATGNLHRDQAHALKRDQAAQVAAGGAAPAEFAAEADLRGLTAQALATLVLSKGNSAAQRELDRQKILAKIAAAVTPAELDVLPVGMAPLTG